MKKILTYKEIEETFTPEKAEILKEIKKAVERWNHNITTYKEFGEEEKSIRFKYNLDFWTYDSLRNYVY